MTCSLCDRTALTIAGKNGFCKEHRTEAVKLMAKVGKTGKGMHVWSPQEREEREK